MRLILTRDYDFKITSYLAISKRASRAVILAKLRATFVFVT